MFTSYEAPSLFEVVKKSQPANGLSEKWPLRQGERIAHWTKRAVQIRKMLTDTDDPLYEINNKHGFTALFGMEGFMTKGQAKDFQRTLLLNPGIKRVAEIGFNGGHSSFVFLTARQDITVTSFDRADHPYVLPMSSYIKDRFKDRFEFRQGDSRFTVPGYADQNPGATFDLIFIDGGHEGDVPEKDLLNMSRFADDQTLVIMDDYRTDVNFGIEPVKAWNRAASSHLITPTGIGSDGDRTWVEGRYR